MNNGVPGFLHFIDLKLQNTDHMKRQVLAFAGQ